MCPEIVVYFKLTYPFTNFSTVGGRILLTTQDFDNHSTLSALTSVLPASPQNVPSAVSHDVSFDDPWTKMLFSDAKTLLTLQKSNLYLQQETKIIKSEERRERMIQIRARFQQIVPPQAPIEFSVDAYNLFLRRSARTCV